MPIPLITLMTDFGLVDPFVGIMKGVILSIAPQARWVDISHQIPPQGLVEAGLCLKQSAPYFPRDTLHVCVVDPGVGSDREIIIARTDEAFFLAPDNGVLTYALEGNNIRSVHRVTHPEFFRHPVSRTFHGRDIFAPVAAHLFLGTPLPRFGPKLDRLQLLPSLPQLQWEGDAARGRIISNGRFGNLLTNVPELPFRGRRITSVLIRGRVLGPLCTSYASVQEKEAGALWASTGHLEIFVRNGSAAESLGAKGGDEVVVTLAS